MNIKNKLHQIKHGLRYYLSAGHKKGYGIHSPFVYRLIREVLMPARQTKNIAPVKKAANILQNLPPLPLKDDFGAETQSLRSSQKQSTKICKQSGLPAKYISLLQKLIEHLNAKKILELGTCCGFTSGYLSKTTSGTIVHTVEGNESRYQTAKRLFEQMDLKNIICHHTTFQTSLNLFKEENIKFDFVFLDGDHTCEATLQYFHLLQPVLHAHSIVVIDDIYWSKGMTKAWQEIQKLPAPFITIDLYRLGIIIYRPQQAKEQFQVRY